MDGKCFLFSANWVKMREKGQQSAKILTHLVTYRGKKEKCLFLLYVGRCKGRTDICLFFFYEPFPKAVWKRDVHLLNSGFKIIENFLF